jgi:hypothetical protein
MVNRIFAGTSPARESRSESLQMIIAVGIFLIGALVYLFDRSGADIYFTPEWFASWPALQNVPLYFLYDHFDPFDLTAIFVGGISAYFSLCYFRRCGDPISCHKKAA